MAVSFATIVKRYQDELRNLPAPKLTFGRSVVGTEGFPSPHFFDRLFQDHDKGIKFLQDCGLLKRQMLCPTCGSDMHLWRCKTVLDEYRWGCGKGRRMERCRATRSLRHGSWFTKSNLSLFEVLIMTYCILGKMPFENITQLYQFEGHTLCDWSQFCKEVLIEFIETNSEMVGGQDKVVEVDESKFGRRKYHRGRYVEGQWVFGGVERDSGRTFLVAVHDRSSETLSEIIKQWILPGTTVITDCWKAYDRLKYERYDHLRVNHSISFVDEDTGAHTNTIESTWRHVKASLNPYNRKGEVCYIGALAEFMFRRRCKAEDVQPFCKFMEIVAAIDWSAEPQ